ncbi:MAG: FAD-binding oxidoreductase [Pleurocapsa sp. SU_196_0]|nr:FAD-binding oxidoreductase [Pleurocapsa sp. SU_196_0]
MTEPHALLLERLRTALGKKVRTDATETLLYRYDAIAQGPAPVAVILAETTLDVATTLRLCNESVPVVPRAARAACPAERFPWGRAS